MRALLLPAPLLIAVLATGYAQPYAAGVTTVAPPSSSATAPEDKQALEYLSVAQGALSAGRAGDAREALEMAQTRMLDRAVPLGMTNNPSDNKTVEQISQALRALAAHDRTACQQLIQAAMQSAAVQRADVGRR